MKQSYYLLLVAISTTLTIKSMVDGKVIAQSEDRSMSIARLPSSGTPFSFYKIGRCGVTTLLYSGCSLIPFTQPFALHTTRGIFITCGEFASFENDTTTPLTAARALYTTIFSNRGALNSLVNPLSITMPNDTMVIINTATGASLYDIPTDSCIGKLPPITVQYDTHRKRGYTCWQEGKKRSILIPYEQVIYIAATKTLMGFSNPIDEKATPLIITIQSLNKRSGKKNSLQYEGANDIDSVEYASAHKEHNLFLFGNGAAVIMEISGERYGFTALYLSKKNNFLISAVEFIEETRNFAVALNSRPQKSMRKSLLPPRIATISGETREILHLIEMPDSFGGIERLTPMSDGRIIAWTETTHGLVSPVAKKECAQDTQPSTKQ
jgi:hypothetical protein